MVQQLTNLVINYMLYTNIEPICFPSLCSVMYLMKHCVVYIPGEGRSCDEHDMYPSATVCHVRLGYSLLRPEHLPRLGRTQRHPGLHQRHWRPLAGVRQRHLV